MCDHVLRCCRNLEYLVSNLWWYSPFRGEEQSYIAQFTQDLPTSAGPGLPLGATQILLLCNTRPFIQPQLTVLRIKIPPHTALHWHYHPVISVGYVVSGELTVEKRGTNVRTTVREGHVLPETVGTIHRGFTTDKPVELIVFYAGQAGTPITVNSESTE